MIDVTRTEALEQIAEALRHLGNVIEDATHSLTESAEKMRHSPQLQNRLCVTRTTRKDN